MALSTAAELWPLVALAPVLAIASATDLRAGKVYNWTTYPAIVLGVLGHSIARWAFGPEYPMGLPESLAGLLVGFLPMAIAWKLGGVGAGDAKLMAAIGALTGWRFALSALFYGLLAAALMALVVMVVRRITLRTLRRVWTFLVLLLSPSKPGAPATQDSPRIPIGFALALGAVAALVEVWWGGSFVGRFVLGT